MKATRTIIACAMLGAYVGAASGCYRYTWQARGAGPAVNLLPVDENNPRSSTRWSFLWGLLQDKWSPTDCASGSVGDTCAQSIPMCNGRPIGRVDTSFGAGSAALMLLTLGIAVPEHVTIYCSTADNISVPPDNPPTDAGRGMP